MVQGHFSSYKRQLLINQFNKVVFKEQARRLHRAIKRHHPPEVADDAFEDFDILLQCIRIVGGHNAPPTELGDIDYCLSNFEAATGPVTLFEAFDATDHDVWA